MTAFYTLVMTLGYTYGVCTGGVSDNILNNFGVDDMLMNTGRTGLAITILVSFPLLTVPLIGTLVRAHREMSSECGRSGPPVVACFHQYIVLSNISWECYACGGGLVLSALARVC